MIPTLLVLGVVAGLSRYRWWYVLAASIGWPVILISDGVIRDPLADRWALTGAALAGAINAAVAVLAGWMIRSIVDGMRQSATPIH